MNYSVEWLTQADDDLMRIWMQHPAEGPSINASVQRILKELSRNAHRKGVPIDNYRYYVDQPLKVLFVVIPDDNQVWVVEAHWVGP